MGRREFLILTGGCAVATVAFSGETIRSLAASDTRQLTIGYAPLELAASGGRFQPNVADAASLTSGDGHFLTRSPRITIFGMSGGGDGARNGHRIRVDAHFPAGGADLVYQVGEFRKVSGSSPVSFTMPVDDAQRIRFSIAVRQPVVETQPLSRRSLLTPVPAEVVEQNLTLGVANDGSTLRLVRGFYILSPLVEGDGGPDWSSLELRREGGSYVLREIRGTQLAAPAFEYVLVRVDYGQTEKKTPQVQTHD
jgi:hypothetical protein